VANVPVPPPIFQPPPFIRRVKKRPRRRLPPKLIVTVGSVVILVGLGLIAVLRPSSRFFVFSVIVAAAVVGLGYLIRLGDKSLKSMPLDWGPFNRAMICPHCQTKGQVRTKTVVRKKGVSGSKATAALLTGGFSLLFIGLSQEEELTQAHCCDCKNTWEF
jgi:hypothetical protein